MENQSSECISTRVTALRSTLYQSLCQGEVLARDANLRPAPNVSSRWTAVMKSYLLSCFFVFYRIESWIEWKGNFQEIWWPQTIRDPAISCSQMTFTRRLKFGRQKTCRLEFEVPAFFSNVLPVDSRTPHLPADGALLSPSVEVFRRGTNEGDLMPWAKTAKHFTNTCLVKSRYHSCSRGFGRALWHADICCGLYVGAKSLEPQNSNSRTTSIPATIGYPFMEEPFFLQARWTCWRLHILHQWNKLLWSSKLSYRNQNRCIQKHTKTIHK